MNFYEAADRDFSIQFCEYNYSNPDYDQIYRPNGSGTEGDNLYSAFRKLRLEMLTNYAKSWDTTELCKTVSLEKSQFYSCYQKFFQSTPHADLLQIRMDKAKNLLTNEALTVQQIAQMCGFSDFSHFSRYFRKQAGCSPLQWRRKMGERH